MCGSTEELLDRVFSCRYVPALVLSMLCMPLAMASAPDAFDLLIRNGLVIDGTGSDPRRADVGVRDGHIVAVGDFAEARAKASIDASGLVVAPGFIDAHAHAPDFFLNMRVARRQQDHPILNEGFVTQGVTTVVVGPDGAFGPDMLRAVERIYSQRGISTNYAFYVGHNGVRRSVMGMAAREATAEELARMTTLVREGMELGAVGLSTGLMYLPGVFSTTEEVIELARAVKPFDGIYDSHVRDPAFKLLESDLEAIRIGREAGVPVKIAHEKAPGRANHGKISAVIDMIERARAEGMNVLVDTYPYDGAQTEFVEDVLVVPGLPREASIQISDKDRAERRRRVSEKLADPEVRKSIRAATENGMDGGFSWVKAVGYGAFRVVDSQDFPEFVGRNVETLAAELGVTPFDLLARLASGSRGSTLLTMADIDEQDLQLLLRQSWTIIASDGGYVGRDGEGMRHPRSTGTFTRVLRRYVRELQLLSLPEAVRRMTSLPADFLQLRDRGRIAPGLVADIVIFDPGAVADRSTWTDPYALSVGISAVIVNGVPVLKGGVMTGTAPGRFVPRQSLSGP